MATPTIEREQQSIGRYGICNFRAKWTVADADDLTEEIILSVEEFSGKFNNTFYAIEMIEWTAGINVQGVVYFDSVAFSPLGNVLVIPTDATSGKIDYREYPQGCLPDPGVRRVPNEDQENAAGNVVCNMEGLPNDELFIVIRYKEKGNTVGKG